MVTFPNVEVKKEEKMEGWVFEGDAIGAIEQQREWAKIILERTGRKMEDMSSEEIFALVEKWAAEDPDNRAFWPL